MTTWIPAGAIPGVGILPHWQALYFTAGGIREVRGIAWHFAEGGGTDIWLCRKDGKQGRNSSHLVLKYDGTLRQIVSLEDASWSLHVDRPFGPPGIGDYGIFTLDAVRAAGISTVYPLPWIIAIEIEGFAKDGPNAAQRYTIARLATYLERLFPKAVHLGHRDFQNYKPCPGGRLFGTLLPHARRLTATPPQTETDMAATITTESGATVWTADPTDWYDLDNKTKIASARPGVRGRYSPYGVGTRRAIIVTRADGSRGVVLVNTTRVEPITTTAPTGYTQAQLDAAVTLATATLKNQLAAQDAEAKEVAAALTAAAARLAA